MDKNERDNEVYLQGLDEGEDDEDNQNGYSDDQEDDEEGDDIDESQMNEKILEENS